MRALAMAVLAASLAACTPSSDLPVTYVAGLRVLAIKADPPEVAPGASATVTALIAGGGGETPVVSWSRCLRAPLPGEAISPACFTGAAGGDLQPVGDGATVTVTMPDVTAAALGQPDASGGVYLPLIARVTAAGQTTTASYRLRLAQGGEPNRNPVIADIVTSDGALDPAAPRAVAAGASLSLSATLAPGSAESYGAGATEVVRTSWFCTAGALSEERTSDAQPTTVLRLDTRLPAPGALIDLYAVARDERGGTDYAHRTLQLQ